MLTIPMLTNGAAFTPPLLSLIHIYVDLDRPGVCFSDRESRHRLCWHARDLAAQLAAEAREDRSERDYGSFLTHKTTVNLLHQLKILRPQQRMQGGVHVFGTAMSTPMILSVW